MKKTVGILAFTIIFILIINFNIVLAAEGENENTVNTTNTTNNDVVVNEKPTNISTNIKDGIYKIQLSSGKVLHVTGASQNNSANIQIYQYSNVLNQKFHIYRVGKTNYYKIIAVHSAKALDVYKSQNTPGANIIQKKFDGSNTQYWYFNGCGNGYYNIVSKSSLLYLDIANGKINNNGSNVQLDNSNNGNSQKFKFVPVNILDDRTYEIETKLSSSKVIEIKDESKKDKAKAVINKAKNKKSQRFVFTAISNNTYKIIAKHSGKALTVSKETKKVYQKKYKGTKNQKWQLVETGEGYFRLVSKQNNLSLNIAGGKNKNGQPINTRAIKNKDYQKFRFVKGFRKFYKEGTYGKSGLKIKGDSRGTNLKYYKIGQGSKVLFTTFSIHGFEDSYDHDGAELTYLAEEFKKYLKENITEKIVNKYTIYIFPCLNPDGQTYGYTNDGPGRTTLYSEAKKHKGIDMNRCFPEGYEKMEDDRNFNGKEPFQAYEAQYLVDFILNHQGKTNILVDTHGWLEETMGDKDLGKYYRKQFGLDKHIDVYGRGYLINWATTLKRGRSVLVELPEVKSHTQFVNRKYVKKWIKATMKMIEEN